MPPINSTASCVNKATLWSALCSAAHDPSVELIGGLVRTSSGWRVDEGLDDESKVLAQIFCPMLGVQHSDRPTVVGHLAQSLDGCIAQADGESHWISGPDDLDHTHRLRAFCDVVLVGAETVALDDCHLTVRRVDGPQPTRLVLDPNARLKADSKVFDADGGVTLWVVGESSRTPHLIPGAAELIQLPCEDGAFDLHSLMSLLHKRGCRRLFVEGGGVTISHFLKAGLLDRLHIAVAPILIGGGRPTIGQALGQKLADCPRPAVRVHPMGADWLFDCDFSQQHS